MQIHSGKKPSLRRLAQALRRLAARADAQAARWALADDTSRVAGPALWIWHPLARTPYPLSLTKTARRLMRVGRHDDAFRLLSAGMGMGRRVRLECTAVARECAFWLAGAGFLEEAEAYIRRLAPENGKLTLNLLAQLWTTFAVLDPRVLPELEQALTLGVGAGYMRRGLRYFSLLSEDGEAVDRLYALHTREGEASAVGIRLDCHAVAAARGLLVPTADIVDFLLAVPRTERPLVIDRFLLASARARMPDDEVVAAEHFVLGVDRACRELTTTLGDRRRTVAIVGNSPAAVGQAQGAVIDAHDIVIRFNAAPVAGMHAGDYGKKTDIHVINQAVLEEPGVLALHDAFILLTGPDWELFPLGRAAVERLLSQGCSVALVPGDLRRQLIRLLGATPSSGLQACALVCALRANSAEGVDFFGFSFTDQLGDTPTSANYFRTSWPNARHNWKGEAESLRQLHATGGVDGVAGAMQAFRYLNHGALTSFRPRLLHVAGDHSRYHCGSSAVMQQLRVCLAPHGDIVGKEEHYEILVINGEGSMHHDSAHFLQKMQLMANALDNGKQVYLVNSVWQANSNEWDPLLRRLAKIFVREVLSQKELRERHGIEAVLYPDLSFYAELSSPRRVIDFGGGIVLTDFYSQEFGTFARWTGAEGLQYPYIDMREWAWSDLVASLRTAGVLVTGRHHAVYAACRAGIPFIAFPGNTHKIEGLMASAGVRIPMCRSRSDLPEAIAWARENRQEYERLFAWLKSFPAWNPFI